MGQSHNKTCTPVGDDVETTILDKSRNKKRKHRMNAESSLPVNIKQKQ